MSTIHDIYLGRFRPWAQFRQLAILILKLLAISIEICSYPKPSLLRDCISLSLSPFSFTCNAIYNSLCWFVLLSHLFYRLYISLVRTHLSVLPPSPIETKYLSFHTLLLCIPLWRYRNKISYHDLTSMSAWLILFSLWDLGFSRCYLLLNIICIVIEIWSLLFNNSINSVAASWLLPVTVIDSSGSLLPSRLTIFPLSKQCGHAIFFHNLKKRQLCFVDCSEPKYPPSDEVFVPLSDWSLDKSNQRLSIVRSQAKNEFTRDQYRRQPFFVPEKDIFF